MLRRRWVWSSELTYGCSRHRPQGPRELASKDTSHVWRHASGYLKRPDYLRIRASEWFQTVIVLSTAGANRAVISQTHDSLRRSPERFPDKVHPSFTLLDDGAPEAGTCLRLDAATRLSRWTAHRPLLLYFPSEKRRVKHAD